MCHKIVYLFTHKELVCFLYQAAQLDMELKKERLQHNKLVKEFDKMRQLLERTEAERDVAIKQVSLENNYR